MTRSRDRQSASNTPSYQCCPGSLLTSSASCTTLPVERSSPALNAVALKAQIPMLRATVWYLMTPWAPHRGSLIATIPRTVQNGQCSKLLLLNAISRLCTRRQVHRENLVLGFKSACPRDVMPPDRFWISVASHAMVKLSST